MNKRILKKFQKAEYRHAFVSANIDQGIAFQIRVMREKRGWDQKELARRLGIKSQSAVARLEDPSYGKISLSTLKKLAKAFDVAALVKLVPYSRLLMESATISEDSMDAMSFSEELPQLERSVNILAKAKIFQGTASTSPSYSPPVSISSSAAGSPVNPRQVHSYT